jgi:hypothetical protein
VPSAVRESGSAETTEETPMTDAKKGEPGAKITPPGGSAPEPSLTVDHDAFLYKSTEGAYSPETVWKLADGTEVRPTDLPAPFAEPTADEPGSGG